MTPPAPTRSHERATQLLSGVLVGALLVYVGVLVARGLAFGLVVLVLGVAVLARNRPRIGRFATGVAISGVVGLLVVLVVLAMGHDLLGG